MKQRQTPCIQLVFAGRRRENRIPNYSELLSTLESTKMCLYMYHSPPDRGPTRLSLSCSFIPVAPPAFLVVMLELLHGVPLAIASSSLLLPISQGSVSHRQTLHQGLRASIRLYCHRCIRSVRRLEIPEVHVPILRLRSSSARAARPTPNAQAASAGARRTLAQAEKHRAHSSSNRLPVV